MNGHDLIIEAARLARLRIELPAIEARLWAKAHAAGVSFNGISRGIAVELARQGCPAEAIVDTGTGPDNIRKRVQAL